MRIERRRIARGSVIAFALAAIWSLHAVDPASGRQAPTCDGRTATIVGTEEDDVLVGTSGADVIAGLGGRDRIFGGGGDDIICGGAGADVIRGQRGRDVLLGGRGNDRIQGNNGGDRIDGGGGRDSIRGDRGPDVIAGGGGSDRINAGADADTCDLDRRDTFRFCERGDVIGRSGVGPGGFNLTIDEAFVAHIGPNRSSVHVVVEIASTGVDDRSIHRIDLLDDDGELIESLNERGREWTGEYIVRGAPARIEVNADGPWEVTIKRPQLIARRGNRVTGNGSQVFFLRRPLGPDVAARFELAPNVSGNVVLWTFAPGRAPILRVNAIFPQASGVDVFEGVEREGTHLVAVEVDKGDWELSFTG